MSRFPVVFDTTAIDELLESKLWYANHLESLGEDFEREVEQHWIRLSNILNSILLLQRQYGKPF